MVGKLERSYKKIINEKNYHSHKMHHPPQRGLIHSADRFTKKTIIVTKKCINPPSGGWYILLIDSHWICTRAPADILVYRTQIATCLQGNLRTRRPIDLQVRTLTCLSPLALLLVLVLVVRSQNSSRMQIADHYVCNDSEAAVFTCKFTQSIAIFILTLLCELTRLTALKLCQMSPVHQTVQYGCFGNETLNQSLHRKPGVCSFDPPPTCKCRPSW